MNPRVQQAVDRIDELLAQVQVPRSAGAGGSDDRRRKAQRDAETVAAIQRIKQRHAPKNPSRLSKLASRIGSRGMAALRRRFGEEAEVAEISNGAKVLGVQLAKRKGGQMYQLDPRVADLVGEIDSVLGKRPVSESVEDGTLDEKRMTLTSAELRRLDRARRRRKHKRYRVKRTTRAKIKRAARRSKAKRRRAQRRPSTIRRRLRNRKRYARMRGRSRRSTSR